MKGTDFGNTETAKTMFRSAIVLSFLITQGYALQSGLFLTNDCPCPGHNLTFECVITGITEGITVWKGDALQDVCMIQEIPLLHSEFVSGITGISECSGGIIAWRMLGVENNSYISQLNITYTTRLNGREVVCAYDNRNEEVTIGTRIITTNTVSPYPPPTGLHLESATQEHLTFAWNPVAPECAAIQYIIQSIDCGICPRLTAYSIASCNQFQVSTNRNLCSFTVQSEFCQHGIAGNRSNQIQIILKVPEPPSVNAIIPRYSHLAGNAIGFIVQFYETSSFDISDGIDGSALSYTLAYNNPVSGVSCGSAAYTVPASSCVDRVCQHLFTYEGPACNSASAGVNVSISAANILGSGPASYPTIVQEKTNTFLGVSFNLASNSIACRFHGEHTTANKWSCSIDYWLKEDKTCILNSASFIQTSYSTSSIVMIGLPTSSLSSGQYCFNVMGDNGTYAAVLEGTFDPADTQDCPTQPSNGIAIGLSLTFVILISVSIITTLVVVVIFLVQAYKKLQVQLVKVQTVKAPALMSTAPGPVRAAAVHAPNSNRIYEDLDGDQILKVENIVYPRKDFHRSRCATPCSDSGEADDAYYSTI